MSPLLTVPININVGIIVIHLTVNSLFFASTLEWLYSKDSLVLKCFHTLMIEDCLTLMTLTIYIHET